MGGSGGRGLVVFDNAMSPFSEHVVLIDPAWSGAPNPTDFVLHLHVLLAIPKDRVELEGREVGRERHAVGEELRMSC